MLEALEITDRISHYSYQHGGRVYLEEDCDAVIFVDAARARGITIEIVTTYANRTPIRGYASYRNG